MKAPHLLLHQTKLKLNKLSRKHNNLSKKLNNLSRKHNSLSRKHKNSKIKYYTFTAYRLLLPNVFCRKKLKSKLETINLYDIDYIQMRVNYYCKLEEESVLNNSIELDNFKIIKRQRDYYFDSYEYTRYFDGKLSVSYKFGDLILVPDEPSIVKSRPIHVENSNSVILKLNKTRHFTFVKDSKSYLDKKNMLISRNAVGKNRQPHRLKFLEQYINHPMCNIGSINRLEGKQHLYKDKITLDDHLKYKFVLCLEGNDVATNLKWVMSSNSIAIMPEPTYETWFMEGTLIPNFHYIKIKEDYSDLQKRMEYYIENTDEALKIIENANAYIKQFRHKKREDLISLLVLEKYFHKTGQKSVNKGLENIIN